MPALRVALCGFVATRPTGAKREGEKKDMFGLASVVAPVEDADTTSHVVCDHEPFPMAETGFFPSHQDDLTFEVERNILCLEQFENMSDPRAMFDYDPAFDHSAMTMLNSCDDNGLDVLNTGNLDLPFKHSYLENSTATNDKDIMPAVPSLPDSSDSAKLSPCFETFYPEAYTDVNSGSALYSTVLAQ
ncbi:hypothetical protein BKA63DRAFT_566653 [Paraphoma chrysanthemicola]|nr:hypothetical protein BKA63DRAFT_566653 [Paraphoma chrysanthemicola]